MFQDGSHETISSTSWKEGNNAKLTRRAPKHEGPNIRKARSRCRSSLRWGQSDKEFRPRAFTHPRASYRPKAVFLNPEPTLTHKVWNTAHMSLRTRNDACADATSHRPSTQQSHQVALVPYGSLSAISGTFNSLFKVLFTFPSWYLFPIGLEPIFSFRWNLPPTLRSNPEERDSKKTHRTQRTVNDERDSHPFLRSFPTVLHLRLCWLRFYRLQFKTDKLPGFTYWAVPCSFAITKGILFSFFSSAYLYA